MGNRRGLGLHLIFVCFFLVAATFTCLGDRNRSAVCSEQERLALLKFKHSVEDPSGIMLSSWVGNDCCQWEGIHCDSLTGTVQRLHLRGDVTYWYYRGNYYLDHGEVYLAGHEVNPCLAELRHLKYLDLSGNYFQGSRIPEFIGSFKQLSYLNLSDAGFQGIIPHHMGNLSNLKVLDLNSNYELMADDMAWSFGLPSLEHLDLSHVNLSRAHNLDMVLYMKPLLKELSLSHCGLYNSDFGSSLNLSRILPNLKHLDLSFNSFKGPLPPFFQNMTSLEFMDLSVFNLSLASNLLNMIPFVSELHLSSCGLHNTHLSSPRLNFTTLSYIQHLDLSHNSIEGIFPSVFTNMSSLRVLDLSGNMLNSSFPIMTNLLELDLSFNQFKQIEHVGIWRQCHLKRLSVSDNSFDKELIGSERNISECSQYALERLDLCRSLNGTIPEPLGRMVNLRRLDLAESILTGPIPESLGRLRFLEVLDLSQSGLTDPIPESLGRLRFLEVLNLSYNRLTGPILTFLGKLSKLDLSFNRLNGSIPESLENLTGLTYLNLEGNRLTGPIPASLGRLVSLQEISVASNLLNGTVPVSIGQLSKLRSLDISENSLEGVIFEAHFANLSLLKLLDTCLNTKLTFNVSYEWIPPFQLHYLDLSSCNIRNGFPQWLQNQRELLLLDLSNATISGPLPRCWRKMPIISYLNLSHNKLTGPLTNIPNGGTRNVLGYSLSMVLFLENNLFNESIPTSFCRQINFLALDLTGNRLSGKIPKCLGNLEKLVVMILSSNQLSGVIPRELRTLRELRVLDLGDNELSGNIPQQIGEKLTRLEVLRLHKNKLTGKIPGSLCKPSKLHILDVGDNLLTGRIPHCLGGLNAMANNSSLVEYDYLYLNEYVIQVIKGYDLEYGTNLGLVYNMDLSSNKLEGEIPVELTALFMLMGLNLSNNHLSGVIPDSIGNMTKLESLDFSRNELTGVIPPSMAALTFLSHLNLSNNNLSGSIPTGHQLQTLDDPSIYAGNKHLCGPPLVKHCSNQEDQTTTTTTTTTSSKKKHKTSDEQTEKWLFGLDIMSGFATGFWGVIGVLLFKKEWRGKLFMFAEETMDKIYVAVIVRVAKIKRGREAK